MNKPMNTAERVCLVAANPVSGIVRKEADGPPSRREPGV